MHTLFEITNTTLSKALGIEVPEIYVVIAKHSVLGTDSESLRELLGCTADELREVETHEDYLKVRAFVASVYAGQSVNQTVGIDHLEELALKNLIERMKFEKDGEFMLRVFAVANKAQRRNQKATGVLDPSIQGGRTVITLTDRLTAKLNGQTTSVEEVRQLSISDGSMTNPTFDEVDALLRVRPRLPDETKMRPLFEDDLDEIGKMIEGDSK